MEILSKLIPFVKKCCRNDAEAKKKRKWLYVIGIGSLGFRVFLKLAYTVNKFCFFMFRSRGHVTKRITLFILIIIVITCFYIYKSL